jgi:modulator of FtsH protease
MGVVFLLAFTFFMGLMLSRLLGYILPMKNGSQIVMLAFGGTALIFGAMSAVALTIKRDLAFMGKFLLIGAGMLMIAGIANVFLLLPGLMIAIAVLAIGIFSALMVYDINRILTGGQTNYVIATLEIYLDIYNVFQSLLILLGFSSSDD